MPVYCNGTAKLRAENGEEFDLTRDALGWEEVEQHDLEMGIQRHFEASYEDKGVEVKWHVWEYPAGAEEETETEALKGEVVKDFDYGFEAGPEEA